MKRLHAWLLAGALALTGCGGGGGIPSASTMDPGQVGGAGGSVAGDGSAGDSGGGGVGSSGGVGPGGTGADGGTGVAGGSGGGVGSGGTGVDGGGTGVASAGDTGVGSGGTGATSGSVGIGSVDGFGSIIVNGVRYDISRAQLSLGGATEIKLGMTVRVTGTTNAEGTEGTATRVISAPELRGRLTGLDTSGRFTLQTLMVTTDRSTVFEGVAGAGGLADGQEVQVYGLHGSNGELRATRIERLSAQTFPVISGAVRGLNRGQRRFTIGSTLIDYSTASSDSGNPDTVLAEGAVVRVQSVGTANGALVASSVQWWQAPPPQEGQKLDIGGLVSEFAGPGSFRVQGVRVDATGANFTSGQAAALGNSVRVEISGRMRAGILVPTKVKVRDVPGTANPAVYTSEGPIGQFRSAAELKVQGQAVDASGPHVVFGNGSAQDLREGRKVKVTGSSVVGGVLIADRVDFDPPNKD